MKELVLLTALATVVQADGAKAQSDAERAVLGTVESMFQAMRTRDTALLRSVFEPGARLVGIRTRADGTELVQTISVDQWVQFVAKDPGPDWTERVFNPVVRIEGTLARWRVVSIADSYQKTDCPPRPRPSG